MFAPPVDREGQADGGERSTARTALGTGQARMFWTRWVIDGRRSRNRRAVSVCQGCSTGTAAGRHSRTVGKTSRRLLLRKVKGKKCGEIEQSPAARTARRSFRLDNLCQNSTGYVILPLFGEAEQFAGR